MFIHGGKNCSATYWLRDSSPPWIAEHYVSLDYAQCISWSQLEYENSVEHKMIILRLITRFCQCLTLWIRGIKLKEKEIIRYRVVAVYLQAVVTKATCEYNQESFQGSNIHGGACQRCFGGVKSQFKETVWAMPKTRGLGEVSVLSHSLQPIYMTQSFVLVSPLYLPPRMHNWTLDFPAYFIVSETLFSRARAAWKKERIIQATDEEQRLLLSYQALQTFIGFSDSFSRV